MVSYLAPGYPAALFEAVADHLGADLRLEEGRSGPDPADDPFADGRADIGWLCSTSFVELTSRVDGRAPSVREVGVAPVPDDPDAGGRPVYFSDVVVRADTAATSLDELAGCRLGCNDPASLSGYHSLRIELDRRGTDVAGFAATEFTGGHLRSLDRVLDGTLDAAVVDSVVRTRLSRERDDVAVLRVVERLGPWPTQPIVMRIDAGEDEIAAVRTALLAMNSDPVVVDLLAASALSHLAPTPATHCDEVRAAIARLDAR